MLKKLKLDYKYIKELDFGILIGSIIVLLYGALNIYTVTRGKVGIYYLKLQLIWLVLGLITTYIILLIDYTLIKNFTSIIYWGSVSMLLLTRIIGSTVNGAQGWISLGNRAIQPAEFAKLGMIMMLAKKLDEMDGNINDVKNFFTLCFYALIPMILILAQPDMGMAMVCFFIVLGIFFTMGLNIKVILGGIMGIAASIAILWNSSLMKAYWKRRLISFLSPESDALGAGLQATRSKIGIGSGGILGTGMGIKTASSSYVSQFVPEAHTDFIFAALGEQWGFVGAVFLLFLYGIIIYRSINIARTSKDIFGSVICVGVVSVFLFSVLQNIGMAVGIMPITGITLPLMSYGGSSVLTNYIAIGLILNIGMRRKKINF
ncbi:rod shape-determining protein RodA [Clostridium algidicarnis]|uniref:rod shape-determining protein RodA n=1 Tax=Clostridium algidicarnis TaxID=37659 RepID=UPI001C0D19C8|nr:rod shape-determining protein RodA [Clostridium algidicarnis]MBU3202718.1 rod shape-determining protein RodA [Clostridium algidicarnis]MBU3210872.1 rod shape-determining protein RodA [Clostridium algidicarnis]MBU3222620.1 rod shape-determining protein RodA [Clostridium algidicarnis]